MSDRKHDFLNFWLPYIEADIAPDFPEAVDDYTRYVEEAAAPLTVERLAEALHETAPSSEHLHDDETCLGWGLGTVDGDRARAVLGYIAALAAADPAQRKGEEPNGRS